MLQSIHVKNLALIEETEVCFSEGLNIVTGETGAGKSLLIGSVNLALGSKFDTGMLRNGADSGFVELVFYDESGIVRDKLNEMDIESDDGTVIITRKLTGGKSTCKINGETVTLKQLQELAEVLIDIYGQHEHHSLVKKQKHLEILDAYGEKELSSLLDEVSSLYMEHKAAWDELKANVKDTSEIERERALLEFECNEIESAHLIIGEDEDLEKQYKKMTNARKIVEALSEAYNLSSESETNASFAIGQALKAISMVSAYDENLEPLVGQLADIESLINDFNRDISSYMSDYEFEESEYREITERLDTINDLKRKYGDGIDEIIKYAENGRKKLVKFDDYDSYIASLQEKEEKLNSRLLDCCEKLSVARRKIAKNLEDKLVFSLKHLNFLTVQFEVSFGKGNVSSKGFDDVEFMISTNPGEKMMPLGNVASGGELSRIMLGIKTVMAEKDDIDTLIFDEIDTGISGKTAWLVSEQLGVLAKKHQVLCITHLPQIAAMADAHYLIEKNADDNSTRTDVRRVCGEESLSELGRLLGSDEQTTAALENAREMQNRASIYKSSL